MVKPSSEDSQPTEAINKDQSKTELQPKRRLSRKALAALLAVTLAGGVVGAVTHRDSNEKKAAAPAAGRVIPTSDTTTPDTEPRTTSTSIQEAQEANKTTRRAIASPRTTTSQEIIKKGLPTPEQLPGYGKKVSEAAKQAVVQSTFRLWIDAVDGSESPRPWCLVNLAEINGRTVGITAAHCTDIGKGVNDPGVESIGISTQYVWQKSHNGETAAVNLKDKSKPYNFYLHELNDRDGRNVLAEVDGIAIQGRSEASFVGFNDWAQNLDSRRLTGVKLGPVPPGEDVFVYGSTGPDQNPRGTSLIGIGNNNDYAEAGVDPQPLYNAVELAGQNVIERGWSGAIGYSASGVIVGGLRDVIRADGSDSRMTPEEGKEHIRKTQAGTGVDIVGNQEFKYYDVHFGILDPKVVADQLSVL